MYPDRKDRTFGNDFPEAWLTISADQSGQFSNGDGLFTFTTIHPLLEGQRSSTGSSSAFEPSAQQIAEREYYWKFVVYAPSSIISAGIGAILNRTLLVFVFMVVIAAAGSWIGARAIVRHKQAEEELKKTKADLEVEVEERTRELREAQEQLVRSERLAVLGQLAGGVRHELRNPLGAIKNAVYYLTDAVQGSDLGEEPEKRRRAAEALWESNQRLEEALLDLQRSQRQEAQQERMRALG